MKSTLYATDIHGKTVKKSTKTFEVCLDHEPMQQELSALQNEAAQWQNLQVIKLYPAQTKAEKVGKFWTLSFEVHADDWLFWCGFCAGKRWGVMNHGAEDHKKRRLLDLGEWQVQI